MTAHVTQAKIKAALEAVAASGLPGDVVIDLRAGTVRLLRDQPKAAQRSPREPEPWEE